MLSGVVDPDQRRNRTAVSYTVGAGRICVVIHLGSSWYSLAWLWPRMDKCRNSEAWRQLLSPLALFPLESIGDFGKFGACWFRKWVDYYPFLLWMRSISRPVPTHTVNIDLLPPPQECYSLVFLTFKSRSRTNLVSLGLRTAPGTVSCLLSGINALKSETKLGGIWILHHEI